MKFSFDNRALSCILLVLALTGCGGCGNRDSVPDKLRLLREKTDQCELLSLEPLGYDPEELPGRFHGWKVLGRMPVDDDKKQQLLEELQKVIDKSTPKVAKACFFPRHGIHAVRGDQIVDILICFECYRVQYFVNAKFHSEFLTSESPQSLFDQVLQEAGVPLAKKLFTGDGKVRDDK